ncbi:RagB/SusD family nutrient uptake outer membrane protein [Zunongwangia sp. H14]|uniref:RagB/SusD family nutrient uptake outer membrane protein n=1 Tax=Zunongwangia sp. H14 TaxID=3240792 RepID=UPI0035685CFC
MKYFKLYITILLITLVGCSDDFLDRTSLNDLGSDNFWSNEADAEMALMGIYSALQNPYLFDSDPYTGGVTRLDYLTDDGYTAWQWMAGAPIAIGQHNATSWLIGDFWTANYRVISRANRVIARVPEIPGIDEEIANRIVAEAKVLRATSYNLLGMTYQDVPLITEPQAVEEADVPKSDRSEIYAFITQDLEAIIDDLPNPADIAPSEFGRIDKGAALAMLSRIYLYNDQFSEAAARAKDVIDLGYYSLAPDYDALFSVANENSNEVVFRVAFDRIIDEGSSFAAYWGYIDYQRALPDLAEAFYTIEGEPIEESSLYNPEIPSENRDPRFSATLLSNGDTWKGEPVTIDEDYYFQRKYTEEENNEDHFNSPQDFYVIRFADVLLMRAEALVQSGAYDESEVIELINQVRDRVDMPGVEETAGIGLSQEELMEVIKHERRVELAFEGLRYFDLVRWEELDDVYQEYMDSEYQRLLDLGYPDVRPRSFISYKWPIPQGEIDVNENLNQHNEW